MGLLDVRFGYAIRPSPSLYNLSLALHDSGFWGDESSEGRALHAYLEGGMVDVPDQYYLGVEGGTKLHLRGEIAGRMSSEAGKGGSFSVVLMLNDPEQTALYPFAVDALTLGTEIKGAL